MKYVLLSVFLNSIAQIAMKLASSKPLDFKSAINNHALWLASFLYVLSIFSWLKGLAQLPLSKAYPFQSLGYVIVFLLSYMILNEKISSFQFLGLVIICFGILILGFKI